MTLRGKVAVVTGAGRGIGRAIALQLAEGGAALSVWDLNRGGAEEAAVLIESKGGHAIACAIDASAEEQIAEAVVRTRAELGPVTILINNAGITDYCAFPDITVEMWERMIQVNLRGPFLCTRALLPDMLAAGWGRIVNISSSSAQTGAKGMAHYVASKGGVIGFTKALAIELAATGITVNNIPPGFVDTPMLRRSHVDIEIAAAAAPMKRPGTPEDIAAACSYLVSEAANYVTGHTLSVNGGRYLS